MSEDTKKTNTTIDAAYEVLKAKLPKVPGSKPDQKRAYLQDLRSFYKENEGTWTEMVIAMGKGYEAYALLSDYGDAFGGSQHFMPQEVHIYLDHWEFCYGPLDSTEERFIIITNMVSFYADDYPELSGEAFIDHMFLIFQLGLSGQIFQVDTVDKDNVACAAALFFDAGHKNTHQLNAEWLAGSKQVGVKTNEYRNHSISPLEIPAASPLTKTDKHGVSPYPIKDPSAILTTRTAKKQPQQMSDQTLLKVLPVLSLVASLTFVAALIFRSQHTNSIWAFGIVGAITFGLIAFITYLFPRVIVALTAIWGALIGGTVVTAGGIIFAYGQWRNTMDNTEVNFFDMLVVLGAITLGIYVGIKLMKRADKWANRFLRK